MAEDFIENIYHKALVITKTKELIRLARCGQTHLLIGAWDVYPEMAVAFWNAVNADDEMLAQAIWSQLEKVRDRISRRELVDAADQLEQMLPLLYQGMQEDAAIDVTEDGYRLYSSQSGFLSLMNVDAGILLHSGVDPMWEARELAEVLYVPRMRRFCTWGCGLGYLCLQMYEYCYESIDIYVYESDEKVLAYAKRYGVLEWIPEDRLHIVTASSQAELLKAFSAQLELYEQEAAVLYFEKDALYKATDDIKAILGRLRAMTQTGRDFRRLTEYNYERNLFQVSRYIDSIQSDEKRTEWLVLGGGPSLDHAIDYIRRTRDSKAIIAATTVYKKLLSEGIKPDYIAVLDPQNRTYGQMTGVADHSAVLFMADGANWQFGEKYKGEKYLVPFSGFAFSRERYENRNMECWQAQGTVAAFCIDIAVYMGAQTIELAGVDLAYPVGHTHASGTMDDREVDHGNMIKIADVNGQMVHTTGLFLGYLQDIEEQVKKYKDVQFYNLSDCGAHIKGCTRRNFITEYKAEE